MALPSRVKIVEVGPRDGLQNEARTLDPATRAEMIVRLAATGLPVIEAGSFVSPKRVPQMADSDQVLRDALLRLGPDASTQLSVLTPNLIGFEAALAAGAREVAVFGAASETFSQRNINTSIDDSLARFAPLMTRAEQAGVRVRGYVSCVLGCPYEGPVESAQVVRVASQLAAMGCYEISLGDTVGVGTPGAARALITEVSRHVPLDRLAVHFHDTYGQALANIYACLDLGIATIDASVAGLGGCPYAPGAAGNVATEEVVYLLDGLGIESGVDLDALCQVGRFICTTLERHPLSRVNIAKGKVKLSP